MPTTVWAPWRMQYVAGPKPHDGCVFCGVHEATSSERHDRLVVASGRDAFVVLNRYPYTAGHLMVVPHRHVTMLDELADDEHDALFRCVRAAAGSLKSALEAEGLNVGMNLGEAAGASIHAHLHVHVVPRWNGDNNFIAVVGDTRVIPEGIETTWQKLRPVLAYLDERPPESTP